MGGGLVPGTYPPPRALRPDLSGERFAVVAGHSLVSMVAHDVLVAGGNAVDAGVAAGLASNVVQVDMANFGGIAPIVVRPAGGRDVWSIAGVGRWSTSASLDAMLQRYAGTLPLDGAPAIVPGAPAAWLQALAQFGTMSLAEVAAPAITLATKGFLLDEATATSIRLSAKGFGRWPSSVAVYQQDGEPLAPGARLRQPALGETLRRLVAAEARASGSRKQRIRVAHREFYEGDIAQTLVSWVTDHGGYLTLDDLAAFEAEVTPAVSMRVTGWDFFTTPSWSQGPVALSILGLLSRLPHSWHHVTEAITLAFNDREDFLGDPDFMTKPVTALLTADHLDQLASMVCDTALGGRPGHTEALGQIRTSTTSIVTMDAAGTTFATSPSDTLDGGPIIPELGIMCSPRGVQSRLDPTHPNRLRPGGRPTITPAPMIGLNGDDAWAIACPGGDVIVQAMAQVIWRVLNEEASLQAAVEAPRIAAFNAPSAFHPHPTADRLVYTEGRIPSEEVTRLKEQGHRVIQWPDWEFDAGSVQMVKSTHTPDGEVVLSAGADPRRSAYAIVR